MEAAVGVNRLDGCPRIHNVGPGTGLKRRGGRARETEKAGGREKALGETPWAEEWEDWEMEEGEACAEGGWTLRPGGNGGCYRTSPVPRGPASPTCSAQVWTGTAGALERPTRENRKE